MNCFTMIRNKTAYGGWWYMAGNQNLGEARKNKNDEFYTRYNDIEAEMNGSENWKEDVVDSILCI